MNSSSTAYTEQPPTVIRELISKSWDVCKLQFDGFPNFKSWHGWENCLKITVGGYQESTGHCIKAFADYSLWKQFVKKYYHKGSNQSLLRCACQCYSRGKHFVHDSEVRFLVCVAAFNIHGTHSLKIFPCRPPIVIAAQTRTQKPETQKVDKMYKNNTVNT